MIFIISIAYELDRVTFFLHMMFWITLGSIIGMYERATEFVTECDPKH